MWRLEMDWVQWKSKYTLTGWFRDDSPWNWVILSSIRSFHFPECVVSYYSDEGVATAVLSPVRSIEKLALVTHQ